MYVSALISKTTRIPLLKTPRCTLRKMNVIPLNINLLNETCKTSTQAHYVSTVQVLFVASTFKERQKQKEKEQQSDCQSVTTTSVIAFYCAIKWEFFLVSQSIYTHPHTQTPSTELLSERLRWWMCRKSTCETEEKQRSEGMKYSKCVRYKGIYQNRLIQEDFPKISAILHLNSIRVQSLARYSHCQWLRAEVTF